MDALTAFHFLRPWWLLAIPLWLWLSLYIWRKGGNGDGWAAVCDPALLSYLTGDAVAEKQRSKLALTVLMLAGSLTLLALAGPAWQQLPQPVYRTQSALVIGLDLSRSMLAEDVKPSRLQRAKQKLQDILAIRKEGQTALVVFAGAAFDVVPLTTDNRAILAMLDSLMPDMMPAQGSRASTALEHADAIFKRSAIKRGTVVLLTDGVDADALDVAAKLVQAGHRVSVIGVGTDAGAPIPAAGEAGGFVKDHGGNIVIPRLDAPMLRDLADAGHGIYQAIRFDDADIDAIPGLKPSVTDQISKQQKLQTDLWREEGPWLLLLVLPLLALAFRRGVLLAVLLLPVLMTPDHADAMAWKDLWQTPDQQGQALMRAKKPEAAAGLFNNPDWKGASLYRAKKYKQAAQALDGVNSADGWYNRGNALAKAGDLKGALAAYDQALKLGEAEKANGTDKTDRTNEDARFNRDLVKKAMQQSQQKKSQQKKSQQKKSDQQKQSDKQNKKNQKKNKQGEQGGKNKDQDKSGSQQGKAKNSDQDMSGQKQGKQDKQHSGDKQSAQQNEKQKQSEQQAAKQKKEQKKKNEQQAQAQQQSSGKQQDKNKAAKVADKNSDPKDKEKSAAMQQWLRRIPDDPGGLLRRKFQYQYQQQGQSNGAGDDAW